MVKQCNCILVCWLIAALLLSGRATGMAEDRFFKVTGPCNFKFPEDHGAHPGYRTEWWYYTGSLTDDAGRSFGFQLTFFRSQIKPPVAASGNPTASPSAWRTNQLYFAHGAVTDISGRRFLHDDRMARGALQLAGVTVEDEKNAGPPAGMVRIFVGNWSAVIGPDTHTLTCRSNDFGFNLTLSPRKPAVAHGDNGYSRKGRTPERASCYYSFTRMKARGLLSIGETSFQVQGAAWMDHEYSSSPLEPTAVGWDWFSLQLSNDTELMLFLIREKNGDVSPASGGTFIDKDGTPRSISRNRIRIDTLKTWESPHSGGRYPIAWRLRIDTLDIDLIVRANLADQELRTPNSTGLTYWEGNVNAAGKHSGSEITASGYVELTGYAAPFHLPM